jgi:hypothetical protein
MSTNHSVTDEQAGLQQHIDDQVNTLNGKMNQAWQGNAADQAVSGAGPLADSADSASSSLKQASSALQNQVSAFHTAYNSVVDMPTSAPQNNVINEMVSGLGVNTPLDQQISNYNADAQHNVQVYNSYAAQSAANAAELPTSFGSLPTPHPNITVVPPAGGSVGGPSFTGATGPASTGGSSPSGYVPPRSTGGTTPPPRFGTNPVGSGNPPAPRPPSGGGGVWEQPGGPGSTGLSGVDGPIGTPGAGGPGFGEPGMPGAGGGYPPGEGYYPGGPGFPGEEGFPGGVGGPGGMGGFPGEEGFPGGPRGYGMPGEFGGPGGFGGAGAGGFGGAGGGAGGAGPAGTGSASAGGPGSAAVTPGAEEVAFGRGGMLGGGVPGEPGGMGPMGAPGRGANGEDDKEHKTAEYLQEADPDALFGSDQQTVPPVIGAD